LSISKSSSLFALKADICKGAFPAATVIRQHRVVYRARE
jgi:hypothetical protein